MLLDQFPKKRPLLPKEIEQIYFCHYKSNRDGSTAASYLARGMEIWMHKQVAKDVLIKNTPKSTLEIGAGTLNQLLYEPVSGAYDIVEPFEKLYTGSPLLERIRTIYPDIFDIPDTIRYDRITSINTFEHLCDLPRVIARAGLMLHPQGELRVSIPSEGTPLWRLGWMLTTGLEFKLRHGLDYGQLLRHEHVNTAREIEQCLRHFFKLVSSKVFGLSRHFSFYQFYACAEPDLYHCREYIEFRAHDNPFISP